MVVRIIANMLSTCDVVVTQENDHFVYILDSLISSYHLDVGGVFGCNASRISASRSLSIHQLYLSCSNDQKSPTATTAIVASSKDRQHEQHYAFCNSLFKSNNLIAAVTSNSNRDQASSSNSNRDQASSSNSNRDQASSNSNRDQASSSNSNRDQASSHHVRSFEQESPLFGEMLASVYGNSKEDLYRSDDGIGIYYRRDRLILKAVDEPRKEEEHKRDDGVTHVEHELYIHSEMVEGSGFLRCTFEIFGAADSSKSNDTSKSRTITLYGGHLKSGEQLVHEIIRCQQLQVAFEDAKGKPNPLLAMDSNNSVLYEKAYSPSTQQQSSEGRLLYDYDRLSALITDYSYTDAVSLQRGTECFKMRHGQGGQPDKSFKLMFDTIDKILVPIGVTILPHVYDRNEYGFMRYDPNNRDFILDIRSSEAKRLQLEEHCRATIHTTCSVEAFGAMHPFAELYPNKSAPSDHPPVSCMIELS